MKPKSTGIAAIAILIPTVALSCFWGLLQINTQEKKARVKPINPMGEMLAPPADLLDKAMALQENFAIISHPQQNTSVGPVESMYGYSPGQSSYTETSPTQVMIQELPIYRLSFIFMSEKGNYCTLDGKMYSEGSALPDGSIIQQIESHRVLIKTRSLQHWIDLNPAETVRQPHNAG